MGALGKSATSRAKATSSIARSPALRRMRSLGSTRTGPRRDTRDQRPALANMAHMDPRPPPRAAAGDARREVAPAYLNPLSHLVALALAEKQGDAAVARVEKQILLAPKSGPHEALLGELHLARGDTKAAETAFRKSIDLDPRQFGPYLALGNLYMQSRQYDQALAEFNELTARNPKNGTPLVLAGIVYEVKGDIPKARQSYEKALTLNPQLVAAANNLAWIYSEHGGDKEKALQLAQTAKEQAPDDPRVSDTLGWILYKRGIYQRSLALLRESAAKLPDNAQVQYHLGMAYRQVGEKDNARKALRIAANSTEVFAGKDEARKALAELN